MHSKNYIHGDVKPLNICESNGRFELIDFDASVRFKPEKDAEYAGTKYSSAYLPPEMIVMDSETKTLSVSSKNVKADPKMDVWAFGCVLYQLCSGASLFRATNEDNLVGDLQVLHNWGKDTTKGDQDFLIRLEEIKGNGEDEMTARGARHLVSQFFGMLSRQVSRHAHLLCN